MEFGVYLLALRFRNLLSKNDGQDWIISEVLLSVVTSMKLDVPTPCQKM